MPRVSRQQSRSGIYHVMVRGINKQDIFLENEDFLRYLEVLTKVKQRSKCILHGYCLMNNHAHLLLEEGEENVGQVMKRLGTSYVRWFNSKYNRIGHLFQDRYRSEAVENDNYFLVVLRYIHQNAVKAGLTRTCMDYPWSSYPAYTLPNRVNNNLVSTELALGMLGGIPQFVKFSEEVTDEAPELVYAPPASTESILALLIDLIGNRPIHALKSMKIADRSRVLSEVKVSSGATNELIAKTTGFSVSTVKRMTNGSVDQAGGK